MEPACDTAAPSDRGSSTLTTVVLTPVSMIVALAAFQMALWTHARAETRAVARDAAVLVARTGADEESVEAAAEAVLGEEVALSGNPDLNIEVDTATGLVVATVNARAPGMFRWSSRPIQVSEAVPLEGFRR